MVGPFSIGSQTTDRSGGMGNTGADPDGSVESVSGMRLKIGLFLTVSSLASSHPFLAQLGQL